MHIRIISNFIVKMQAFGRFLAVAGVAAAFPLQSLEMDQATVDQLNTTEAGPARDALTTKILLPYMQQLFSTAENAIEVTTSDIDLVHTFPDEELSSKCSSKIKAIKPTAHGSIVNTSYLRHGVNHITWNGLNVFVDGELDSQLALGMDLQVEVGIPLFKKCVQLGVQTFGVDGTSDGETGVGVNLTTSNSHLTKDKDGHLALVFNFHATVVGTVLRWNVDQVVAKGCSLTVFGFKIVDVCKKIEDKVRGYFQKIGDHALEITAPKILKKVEDKINTVIGQQVTIPLRIPFKGTEVVV